jgi:hypothetical protein
MTPAALALAGRVGQMDGMGPILPPASVTMAQVRPAISLARILALKLSTGQGRGSALGDGCGRRDRGLTGGRSRRLAKSRPCFSEPSASAREERALASPQPASLAASVRVPFVCPVQLVHVQSELLLF